MNSIFILIHFVFAKIFIKHLNVQVEIPEEFKKLPKGRYLIIANHRKKIDPVIIIFTLPNKCYRYLLPVKFFTANEYFDVWWLRFFLWISGCFRAYKDENRISGVKGGLFFSDRKNTLVIFPEGEVILENKYGKPKLGIAYLALNRDFTILPVHINYEKKIKGNIKVKWGIPFKSEDLPRHKNADELAECIFNHVKKLN